jgi:hypothetical protein
MRRYSKSGVWGEHHAQSRPERHMHGAFGPCECRTKAKFSLPALYNF